MDWWQTPAGVFPAAGETIFAACKGAQIASTLGWASEKQWQSTAWRSAKMGCLGAILA